MLLEVMGVTQVIFLYGGLAGGAQIILIPEIPFSYESIYKKILERKKLVVIIQLLLLQGAREKDHKKFLC